MAEKNVALTKISKASDDCSEVQKHWHAAFRSISGDVSTNGYGIYHGNGRELRAKLFEARSAITQAIEIMDKIDWPDDSDYDLV